MAREITDKVLSLQEQIVFQIIGNSSSKTYLKQVESAVKKRMERIRNDEWVRWHTEYAQLSSSIQLSNPVPGWDAHNGPCPAMFEVKNVRTDKRYFLTWFQGNYFQIADASWKIKNQFQVNSHRDNDEEAKQFFVDSMGLSQKDADHLFHMFLPRN